ncbi:ANL family adenylate-forming protein [Vibrio aestuarianus]|uniref:ANL family adenylate-forming protein n=1 Tax=Vibrio aestuarianus TaxID=28171 RepID=UPI00237D2824|nr:fatty acid--CoA ligase family protein [Vibrio aestuarianus]MDE1330415.1 fatty acid--CoA ligase family protein [Vibrio aestuarianus]
MDWLLNRFSDRQEQYAIAINKISITYEQLYRDICEWKDIIHYSQIPQGAVVSIESSNSPKAISVLIALMDNKNIIVPINSNANQNLAKQLEIAQVEYRLNLENETNEFVRQKYNNTNMYYQTLIRQNNSGLVLFSSGTTGDPKASVLNFDKILNKHKEATKKNTILSFLSFDHIGGLNTIFYTLCTGGMVVIPENRNVKNVMQCIEKWQVEILPTTPTFINMMLMSGILEKYNSSSIKLITYGTEPMPLSTLKKINLILPNVRLKQTYGLSEVGILATKSKSNNELWLKLGGEGINYKVIDNILWVKSEMSMLGYLNAEAPFDEDGYFNTQDIVEIDDDSGYLRIIGRKSEIINVAGEKVYPTEIENTILDVVGVIDVSIIGERNPVTGMAIKAFIKTDQHTDIKLLKRNIIDYCKSHMEPYKIPMIFKFTYSDLHSSRFKKMRSLPDSKVVEYA